MTIALPPGEQTGIRIEVTQEDIDNGVPRNASKCAITLAIQRHVKAKVNTLYHCFLIKGVHYLFDLPEEVTVFIKQFEADKTSVKPFSFLVHTHPLIF